MKKDFITTQGETALQAVDGGEEWFVPAGNPFGHGCCDCGLFHQVEFCLVDDQGNEQPLPAGVSLALRFTRDEKETRRLREHQASPRL